MLAHETESEEEEALTSTMQQQQQQDRSSKTCRLLALEVGSLRAELVRERQKRSKALERATKAELGQQQAEQLVQEFKYTSSRLQQQLEGARADARAASEQAAHLRRSLAAADADLVSRVAQSQAQLRVLRGLARQLQPLVSSCCVFSPAGGPAQPCSRPACQLLQHLLAAIDGMQQVLDGGQPAAAAQDAGSPRKACPVAPEQRQQHAALAGLQHMADRAAAAAAQHEDTTALVQQLSAAQAVGEAARASLRQLQQQQADTARQLAAAQAEVAALRGAAARRQAAETQQQRDASDALDLLAGRLGRAQLQAAGPARQPPGSPAAPPAAGAAGAGAPLAAASASGSPAASWAGSPPRAWAQHGLLGASAGSSWLPLGAGGPGALRASSSADRPHSGGLFAASAAGTSGLAGRPASSPGPHAGGCGAGGQTGAASAGPTAAAAAAPALHTTTTVAPGWPVGGRPTPPGQLGGPAALVAHAAALGDGSSSRSGGLAPAAATRSPTGGSDGAPAPAPWRPQPAAVKQAAAPADAAPAGALAGRYEALVAEADAALQQLAACRRAAASRPAALPLGGRAAAPDSQPTALRGGGSSSSSSSRGAAAAASPVRLRPGASTPPGALASARHQQLHRASAGVGAASPHLPTKAQGAQRGSPLRARLQEAARLQALDLDIAAAEASLRAAAQRLQAQASDV